MKKLTLSLCLLFCCSSVLIAKTRPVYVYGEIGGGTGSHSDFRLGVNVQFNTNKIATFALNVLSRDARNLPYDLTPEFHFFGDGIPNETGAIFSFIYGKVFPTVSPNVRFTLKGGVTTGTIEKPENFVPAKNRGLLFLGSNYDYTYNTKLAFGAVFNPTMEVAFGRHMGMNFGIYTNVNNISPMVTGEICLLFGKLRGKIIRKAPETE